MFIIAVYCPPQELEQIKQAMFAAGGGGIGQYDCCAFEYRGVGQFRPRSGANPWLGEIDVVERVDEIKLEMVCKEECITQVLIAMRATHPYQEPAFHVIKDYSRQFQD